MGGRIKQRSIELKITGLSEKGNGIGEFIREDETKWLVEVPFAIPGDHVQTLLLNKRRGVYKGRLEELIAPAQERIQPKCSHFGVCGGCRWQQMDYSKQLEVKDHFLRHLFAHQLTSDVHYYPIMESESPWNYRNKMEFSFSMDKSNTRYLGLVMDSSKGRVFNLTECHLVNSWFASTAEAVRNWWYESGLEAYHPFRDTGSLRTLTLREGMRTGDKMVMLTVSGNPDFALKKSQMDNFVSCVRDAIESIDPLCNLSIFLRIHQSQKGVPTNFYEWHLHGPDHIVEKMKIGGKELTFKVSPNAFFQPNTAQAEKMVERALELSGIPEDGVVYDLYCGTGTLAICAASKASHVLGVELSRESVLDARENVAANGVNHVEILQGDVGEVLQKIADEKSHPSPDLVMLDPPRSGLGPQAVKLVGELGAPKILYLSCNPKTQVKDIAELQEFGYRLHTLQPVDQFPQTYHLENIAILVKE